MEHFVKELDALPGDDEEVEHGLADAILLRCLRSLGADDVATAFERARDRVGFWYA